MVRGSPPAATRLLLLAAAMEPTVDSCLSWRAAAPDRQAWHRAQAALGPDKNLADELEGAADRAKGRESLVVAATLLERAAAFTPVARRRRWSRTRPHRLRIVTAAVAPVLPRGAGTAPQPTLGLRD